MKSTSLKPSAGMELAERNDMPAVLEIRSLYEQQMVAKAVRQLAHRPQANSNEMGR